MEVSRPRDIQLERELTRQAAERAQVTDVDGLSAFAEARAGHGPVRGAPDRDLMLEAIEEFADGRNYVVWEMVEQYRDPDTMNIDVLAALGDALRSSAVAFDALTRARALKAAA